MTDGTRKAHQPFGANGANGYCQSSSQVFASPSELLQITDEGDIRIMDTDPRVSVIRTNGAWRSFSGEVIDVEALAANTAQGKRHLDDASWNWHVINSALMTSGGKILSTSVAGGGALNDRVKGGQYVDVWDGATLEWERSHLLNESYSYDDHNAPGLIMNSAGQLVVALTGHNDDASFQAGWSSNEDPATMSALTTYKTKNGPATYIQLLREGARLFLLIRASTNDWELWTNDRDGDPSAWVFDRLLVKSSTQTYIRALAVTGGVIEGIGWDHPTKRDSGGQRGNIYYFNLDTAVQSDVDIGGLPLIYNASADWYYDSARVMAVNDDATQILYTKFNVGVHDLQPLWLARLTGQNKMKANDWTHEALGEGVGAKYSHWEPSHYTGGGEIVTTGATETSLFLAYQLDEYDATDPEQHVAEYWTRPDPAVPWVKTRLFSDARYLARPMRIEGAADMAIYMQLQFYNRFDDLASRGIITDKTGRSIADVGETDRINYAGARHIAGVSSSTWDTPDLDLSCAFEGDVLVAILQYSCGTPMSDNPVVTLGGQMMIPRSFHTSGRSDHAGTAAYTTTVSAGGVNGRFNAVIETGSTNFQILHAFVLKGVQEAPLDIIVSDSETPANAIVTAEGGLAVVAALSVGGGVRGGEKRVSAVNARFVADGLTTGTTRWAAAAAETGEGASVVSIDFENTGADSRPVMALSFQPTG